MELINVTDQNFKDETRDGVVVLEIWAPWCGASTILRFIMRDLAVEFENVKFCRLNYEVGNETAKRYRVMAIPLILIFKDGVQVDKVIGMKGCLPSIDVPQTREFIRDKVFRLVKENPA